MAHEVSSSLPHRISRLVAEVVNSKGPTLAGDQAREIARTTGALVVYADLGATITLSPSGTLLEYPSVGGPAAPPDDDWTAIALASAVRRYPELAELLPPRPKGAVACRYCDGVGWITPPGTTATLGCWECRSLGWIVPRNL